MPQHILCPNCHKLIAIPDYSPARVTCPNCLRPLQNPNPGVASPEIPFARRAPHQPVPTPSDVHTDTQSDMTAATVGFVALGLLLIASAVLSLSLHSPAAGIVLFLIGAAIGSVLLKSYRDTRPTQPGQPPATATSVAADALFTVAGCIRQVVLIVGFIILLLFGLCTATILVGGAVNRFL